MKKTYAIRNGKLEITSESLVEIDVNDINKHLNKIKNMMAIYESKLSQLEQRKTALEATIMGIKNEIEAIEKLKV